MVIWEGQVIALRGKSAFLACPGKMKKAVQRL